jgi:glycosyltransferase 2 family protein
MTIVVALGIVISVVFGYIALEKISLDQVKASLSGANYIWVIPSVALTIPIAVLRAIRWRILFKDPETVPVGQSFAAISVGLMFNSVLPARAGEVPRIVALRRTTGLSAFEIGATVVVERILDVFVVALMGAALWAFFPDKTWIHLLGLVCFGVIAAFALLLVALAVLRERLPPLLLRMLNKLPFVSPDRARSVRLALGAGASILLRPKRLVEAVLVTITLWGVGAMSIWVLLPAFDIHVGGVAPWLILVANTFAVTIPSGPATVGVYEASVQAALIAYGVSASTALSYAIVLHAVNFFPVILVGLVSSWWISRHPAHARFQAEPA